MSTYGVVLSGGGIKGVAHLAFLDEISKKFGRPSALSGSSAGALVGACYGYGMSSRDIIEFFRLLPIFRITWVSANKPGIIDTDRYLSILEKFLPPTFQELDTYLSIAVVNLEESKVEYIDKGNLYPAILASCAIPLIYAPVVIGGKMYADGGIMDNFPIEPLLLKKIPLFGSYVSYPGIRSKQDLNSALKVINHANYLLLHSANAYKFLATEHTVIFDLAKYGTLDNKKIDEIYHYAARQMRGEKLTLPQS